MKIKIINKDIKTNKIPIISIKNLEGKTLIYSIMSQKITSKSSADNNISLNFAKLWYQRYNSDSKFIKNPTREKIKYISLSTELLNVNSFYISNNTIIK